MKKYIITLLFLFIGINLFAQRDFDYSFHTLTLSIGNSEIEKIGIIEMTMSRFVKKENNSLVITSTHNSSDVDHKYELKFTGVQCPDDVCMLVYEGENKNENSKAMIYIRPLFQQIEIQKKINGDKAIRYCYEGCVN